MKLTVKLGPILGCVCSLAAMDRPNLELLEAVRMADSAQAERLIAHGAPALNWTLIEAAARGHVGITTLLLGKDATGFEWVLNEALKYAVYEGHTDIVRLLLEKGATNGDWALMEAASRGYIDTVRLLLEKGAAGLDQALAVANSNHRYDVLVLIKLWMLPKFAEFRANPLAFIEGHVEVSLKMLVMWAIILHHNAALDYLLAETAARSALAVAPREDVARLANASYGTAEDGLITALMLAASFGFDDMAQQLLTAGADIKVKNMLGETAFDLACKYRHYAIATAIMHFATAGKGSQLFGRLVQAFMKK